MKRIIYLFIVVLVLVSAPLFSQVREASYEVKYLLENFDPGGSYVWKAEGSSYIASEYPVVRKATTRPNQLFLTEEEGKNYEVLGVRAKFRRKGYNAIEIYPTANGKAVTIPINGKCKNLDIWVWGGNYDYTLYACVKDHNGMVHTLRMGTLDFIGWMNLETEIPNYIPQAQKSIPKNKYLEFVKLVIKTSPKERVDDFYVYFDELTVTVDLEYATYDGDVLSQPGSMNSVWGDKTSKRVKNGKYDYPKNDGIKGGGGQ